MNEVLEQKHVEVLQAIAAAREAQQAELTALKARLAELEADRSRPQAPAPIEARTLGQMVIESPEVKEFASRHRSGQVAVQTKAVITSGTLPPRERIPEIAARPARRVRVRDLIPRETTTAQLIEFVRQTSATLASPVAENTAKPEATIGLTLVSVPVRTIAHWVPATRQVLDDLPGLQALVDTELLLGLLDMEDWQLLYGDGTGENLTGIYHQASAYAGTYQPTNPNYIDKLTAAAAEVEARNYVVDSIILHPADFRRICMIRGDSGYLVGGPITAPAQTLWGMTIALTTAMTPGNFLIGQAQGTTTIYDREEARVVISTEHSDFFVKNLIAVRAEERLALVVRRPDAWTKGTF